MASPTSTSLEIEYPSLDAAECPYPLFAQLREEAPVYNVPGTNRYLVTRREDILWVGRHTELFSHNSRRPILPFDALGQDAGPLSLFELDPPEHKPRRDIAYRPFTPGRLRSYEPIVYRIADELIDGFIANGRVELVTEFANLLPMLVMTELLGFSRDDVEWLKPWGLVETSGMAYQPPEVQEVWKGYAKVAGERMTAAIQERAENPSDDILSELIAGHVERSGTFDLAIIRADASNIYRGGIITTAHAIAMAMLLLLQHPDQMAAMAAEPTLIPKMFEEAIRLESPVQWNPRIAREDTEIGGVPVPRGSQVIVLYAAANRDDEVFEHADTFDARRKNAMEHVCFGYGAHFCLGAPIARLEARVAFERILARLHDLRLAPENDFTHITSALFRGLNHLWLEFEPAVV